MGVVVFGGGVRGSCELLQVVVCKALEDITHDLAIAQP